MVVGRASYRSGSSDGKGIERLYATVQKEGNTVLYSSHNLDAVEKTCDRAYIINDGKLVAEINIEEFKRESNGVSLEEAFIDNFYER